MKQKNLFEPVKPPVKGKPSPLERVRKFEAQNLAAARAIVRNPAPYRGAVLQWAKAFLQKHAPDELAEAHDEKR